MNKLKNLYESALNRKPIHELFNHDRIQSSAEAIFSYHHGLERETLAVEAPASEKYNRWMKKTSAKIALLEQDIAKKTDLREELQTKLNNTKDTLKTRRREIELQEKKIFELTCADSRILTPDNSTSSNKAHSASFKEKMIEPLKNALYLLGGQDALRFHRANTLPRDEGECPLISPQGMKALIQNEVNALIDIMVKEGSHETPTKLEKDSHKKCFRDLIASKKAMQASIEADIASKEGEIAEQEADLKDGRADLKKLILKANLKIAEQEEAEKEYNQDSHGKEMDRHGDFLRKSDQLLVILNDLLHALEVSCKSKHKSNTTGPENLAHSHAKRIKETLTGVEEAISGYYTVDYCHSPSLRPFKFDPTKHDPAFVVGRAAGIVKATAKGVKQTMAIKTRAKEKRANDHLEFKEESQNIIQAFNSDIAAAQLSIDLSKRGLKEHKKQETVLYTSLDTIKGDIKTLESERKGLSLEECMVSCLSLEERKALANKEIDALTKARDTLIEVSLPRGHCTEAMTTVQLCHCTEAMTTAG
jgi:hypothetical protein